MHQLRFTLQEFKILLVALACLLSGLTIEAQTGRGFILLSLPIVALVCLIHLASPSTYLTYVRQRVLGALLFCSIAILNGSRPETVILILSALIFFDSLESIKKTTDSNAAMLENLLSGVLLLLLIAAFFDFEFQLFGDQISLWSSEKDELIFPRLKLLFSEPSYLGAVAVGLLFFVRGVRLRWLLGGVAIMSQSYFALAYFGFLLTRNKPILCMIISATIGLFLFIQVYWSSDSFFFDNSGFVRLIGLIGLEEMSGLRILFGYGLGAGDEAIAPVFDIRGVSTANGFLFSLMYDLGFFGILGLYLAYTRKWFDVLHLTFLLLNFGAGSFLIPILMCIVTSSVAFSAKDVFSFLGRIFVHKHERVL